MEAELLKKIFADFSTSPAVCLYYLLLGSLLLFVGRFIGAAADKAFALLAENLKQRTGLISLCRTIAQMLGIAIVIYSANAVYWPHAAEKVVSHIKRDRLLEIVSYHTDSGVAESTMQGNIHRVMGPYTLTLPPAKLGMHGKFVSQAAAVFSVKAGPDDRIILSGSLLPKGNKISSDGFNSDYVDLRCLSDNIWEAEAGGGLFIDGGS